MAEVIDVLKYSLRLKANSGEAMKRKIREVLSLLKTV
jgi:hypothetical protein